jgi:hypothetical protein
MEFERDGNIRRRLDGQEMMERDAEVARLRQQSVSFRVIAARLDMSLGSVQKAVDRVKRRAQAVKDLVEDDDDALDPLPLDDDQPVGSVRFVGVDEVDLRVELFADERGRRFNLLDLYRHTRVDGGVLFRGGLSAVGGCGSAAPGSLAVVPGVNIRPQQ